MTSSSQPPDEERTSHDNDGLSLIGLLLVVAKHKLIVLGVPFVTAVLIAGYTLTLPNIYTANTKILPPQPAQSAANSMLQQLGGLGSLLGGAGALKNSNDLYIAMLKSRTVADNLIRRFELMKLWNTDEKHPSDAYKKLAGVTSIVSGKDGLISIEVDDQDAKRASELANAYVEELFKFTGVIAVTEASQRRLFFERQFRQAKENLAKAEHAARQGLQTGGLVKVDDQGRAMVETTARLRGQITVKEVQIGAMRTFAADHNPDLRLAQQELESLKRELAKIEGAGTGDAAAGRSGQGIDSLGLLRDVKYYEILFELLGKQFEMAKIDEAKESSVVQVIDRATVPDRKSNPKRAQIVLISAFIAGFFGLLWAFLREAMERAKTDQEQSERLRSLKHYLWRR
jgi:tyrosine-protein kinase Etk/Wzc